MVRNFGVACLALLIAGCGGSEQGDGPPPKEAVDRTAKLTAAEVVAALQAKGLPLENVITYTAETDENQLLGRPGQYVGKSNFSDSRHPADDSPNTVEVFATEADAIRRRDYIASVTEGVPMFLQYQVLSGNVLMRLDKALTPDQAAEYEAALVEVVA